MKIANANTRVRISRTTAGMRFIPILTALGGSSLRLLPYRPGLLMHPGGPSRRSLSQKKHQPQCKRPPSCPEARLSCGPVATEEDVRRIALSLPEVTEKPWHGTPGFRVKDKSFLRIRSEAEGGLVVFVSDLAEKEMLLASDPEKFFTTPHYDGHPVVLVQLPAIDVEELSELITDSWRLKAPKRVLAAHQRELPGGVTE